MLHICILFIYACSLHVLSPLLILWSLPLHAQLRWSRSISTIRSASTSIASLATPPPPPPPGRLEGIAMNADKVFPAAVPIRI